MNTHPPLTKPQSWPRQVSVIITDFNGYAQTRRCLEALHASHYQKFKILVVDHGTTDETRIGLATEFPDVIRIAGSPRLWWTGATNLGIRTALARGTERVMLLNNDCYVTPETIGTLVRLAQRHPDTIIAPVQRDSHSGRLTSISPSSLFLLGFPTIPGPSQLTATMAARELLPVRLIGGGRGAIIPASVFRKLGLLDEDRLPHYWADHDFYLRARRHHIVLCVATHTFIDVDHSRTTLADRPETLNLSSFLNSLRSIRSHRNLRDVTALFKKQYPIRHIHLLGVVLYTGRYLVVYLIKRGKYLLTNWSRTQRNMESR